MSVLQPHLVTQMAARRRVPVAAGSDDEDPRPKRQYARGKEPKHVMEEEEEEWSSFDEGDGDGEGEESGEGEEGEEADPMDTLKEQLAEVPFEELQKMRKQGFHDYKNHPGQADSRATAESEAKRKRNKHAPREQSSKVPVKRFHVKMADPAAKRRDPRFDDLSGGFNPVFWENKFSFVDDMRKKELDELRKDFKKEQDPEEKVRLQRAVNRLESSIQQRARMLTEAETKSKRKQAEKKLIEQGKKPFFTKKNVSRQMDMHDKFSKLKESGGLNEFMMKKRKRNASKDHRFMPYQ